MTDSCRWCASERLVPVLYERLERATWKAGNKYRKWCRECERWLPCCSKELWRTHAEPQVLPADADPDDPTLVPADETEFADRLANTFDCPKDGCTASHTGYPNECAECGATYKW